MKRLVVILLLSCISYVGFAQRITYNQVANAKSLKEFKKMEILSYEASNGEVFSVGETVKIGMPSGYAYKRVTCWRTTYVGGDEIVISKITVNGNQKQGFFIMLQLDTTPMANYVTDLEDAICIGEVVDKCWSESKSADNLSIPTLSSHACQDGTVLEAGKTEIEIAHIAEKRYQTLSCDTQQAGVVTKLVAISVQPKGKNDSIVKLILQSPTGNRITVSDADKALELGEIYVVQQ